MTDATPESQTPATPAMAMLVTLGTIALISGLLVVLVVEATASRIAENQRIATEKAVFRVLPGAERQRGIVVQDGKLQLLDPTQAEVAELYAAYEAGGKLRGVAIPAAAPGYAGLIHALYGYDPACKCIVGFKVLKSIETPGLGDKIDFDEDFLRNFEALDARLDETGGGLANAIRTVKHGSKIQAWEIDAISGSTVSSKSVGRMLNQSAGRYVPLVEAQLDLLEGAGDGS
ncbi:MAG: FMN-binding protein [Pseudomonadota bacterium]